MTAVGVTALSLLLTPFLLQASSRILQDPGDLNLIQTVSSLDDSHLSGLGPSRDLFLILFWWCKAVVGCQMPTLLTYLGAIVAGKGEEAEAECEQRH